MDKEVVLPCVLPYTCMRLYKDFKSRNIIYGQIITIKLIYVTHILFFSDGNNLLALYPRSEVPAKNYILLFVWNLSTVVNTLIP